MASMLLNVTVCGNEVVYTDSSYSYYQSNFINLTYINGT